MPIDIQPDPTLGILRARYSGELDLKARIEHGERLMQEAARTGLWRWLLDFRLAQARSASADDAVRMASHFEPRMPAALRMAYLLRYDHQLDPTVEERMRTFGRRVERFHHPDAAIAWLIAPDIDPASGDVPQRPVTDDASDTIGAPGDAFVAALDQLAADLAAAGLAPAKVQSIVARMAAALRAPRPS